MREEEYIVSEEPEINLGIGTSPTWLRRIRDSFPAFRERNFRLYFNGQLISMIGTWLQTVAQGWLVLELTHSAFWVGMIAALNMLPVIFFSLLGGVIVDRLDKRKILLSTQVVSMALAAILGFLAVLHVVNLLEIAILAILLGAVNALDLPARQAFVAEIIRRENLSSAIALNSATFNASRVIGPAIAGWLIALIGTGGAFLVNAASFIAAIISLTLIHFDRKHLAESHPHPFLAIKAGLHYAFTHSNIRLFLIAASVVSLFGFSYTSILPAITEQVFHRGAEGLGYLYTASGLGAMVAAILISFFSKRFGERLFIVGGNFMLGIALLLFSYAMRLETGFLFSFFIGLSFALEFTMINSTILNMIDDSMRGRVMSIFVLMFMGAMPIGSFAMGYAADRIGFHYTILIGSIGVLLMGLILLFNKNNHHSESVLTR